MSERQDGYLDEDTRRWVQAEADKHHGGDFGAAAAAILEAVYRAEQTPGDPWAGLTARLAGRRSAKPPGQAQ